jgi:hypothetical protein
MLYMQVPVPVPSDALDAKLHLLLRANRGGPSGKAAEKSRLLSVWDSLHCDVVLHRNNAQLELRQSGYRRKTMAGEATRSQQDKTPHSEHEKDNPQNKDNKGQHQNNPNNPNNPKDSGQHGQHNPNNPNPQDREQRKPNDPNRQPQKDEKDKEHEPTR